MANKSDNFLAHVEALREFFPHAPELNEGQTWNNDFSFYKITESTIDETFLLSTPNWTKIDIRRAQGVASFAPVGWLLVITDLPINTPIGLCDPRNNCIVLLPGERISITNKDWVHATWVPNFRLRGGPTYIVPFQYTPGEKYLVIEHNPNKQYTSPTRELKISWNLSTTNTTAVMRIRNFYLYPLSFKTDITDISHPAHDVGINYLQDEHNMIHLTNIPVLVNQKLPIKGILSPQETIDIIHTFASDPSGTYFRLVLSPRRV